MLELNEPQKWKRYGYKLKDIAVIRHKKFVLISKKHREFPMEFNKHRKLVMFNELGSKKSKKLNSDWIWYKTAYRRLGGKK